MFNSNHILKSPVRLLGVCVALGITGISNGCSTGFFGSKKPTPRSGVKDPNKSPNKSPNETNSPDKKTPEQAKSVIFELQPAPPDSWWNNCVSVVFKGQTIEAGCSKTGGGLQPVTLEVPADATCISIAIQVKTYKNVGSTCGDRFKQGLPCEGPYAESPEMTRTSDANSDSQNFVWETNAASAESTLKFEDQPSQNVIKYQGDASKAEELGIDFNDVVLSIRPVGVQVMVKQAATASTNTKDLVCQDTP